MRGDYCYWKDGPKKYVKLLIKDSYRLIPMKLEDIPKNLDFKDMAQKEIMYYDMYNHNTMGRITKMGQKEIQEYITKFNENSQDTTQELKEMENAFWDNLKNWKCVNNDGTYDLLTYSKKYCMMDCEVLKIGMEKWEKLWRDIDNRIDVNKFYSLPSLADYYFKINDCFDGCYQMAGSLGQFFDNFVVGGRTMTRENKNNLLKR